MAKAIVLAGGGARGSYHIGAWQALTEMGYRADIVTGTSVGSMNATLVALDWFDEAKAMWLSLNDKDVLDLPSTLSGKEILQFVRNVAKDGGMSVEPLENMITRFLDEDALRKSKCRYGLVTVNLNTLKPLELTLEEIPHGQLVDYVMASGACFPLLKMKVINGEKFIDGGYFDNIPTNLAAKMGATEIVEVDLDGVGNSRPLAPEYQDVKITKVKCCHDLGTILSFKPETAKRNIELGYLDTYKAFGRLEGKAYAFKKGETEKMERMWGEKLFNMLLAAEIIHPTIALANRMFFKKETENPDCDKEKFTAVLEQAMSEANAPITEIYTAQTTLEILKNAKLNLASKHYEELLADTPASRLLAPVGAANLPGVYLALLQQII